MSLFESIFSETDLNAFVASAFSPGESNDETVPEASSSNSYLAEEASLAAKTSDKLAAKAPAKPSDKRSDKPTETELQSLLVDARGLYVSELTESKIEKKVGRLNTAISSNSADTARQATDKQARPSDEAVAAVARQLRQDLHVDRWFVDIRGGDAAKVASTLSTLPRDEETMQRLVNAYKSDKDNPNANLMKDIEARLSTTDADSLRLLIEAPESKLMRLEAAALRGTPEGFRELKNQLSILNSAQIEAANQESMLTRGKTLAVLLFDNQRVPEADKSSIQILMQGSEARAKDPEIACQLGAEALKTKDLDLLRVALATSPEARELFKRRGNTELLSLAFAGKDLKTAQDIADGGEVKTSTLVEFNQGLFGTDKDGVVRALKNASLEQLTELRRGHELARRETCPANLSPQDIAALENYRKFAQSLTSSFNSRVAGELEAKLIYGDKNIISQLAETHSDGLLGLGSGHDKVKIYELVDRGLSAQDFKSLKEQPNFRSDLQNTLKTFLSSEEQARVNEILERKLQAGSYEESKSLGRTTPERLADLRDGGVSSADRATAIKDILTMSKSERAQYRGDGSYRQLLDSQLRETLGDSDETKIASRLLDLTVQGKDARLNPLERVQVGGLRRDSLPKTIESIENFFKSDESALNRFKNPISEDDKQAKRIVEGELRLAVYRSNLVYYRDGKSNFEDIYRPLATALFERNGKLGIDEKLSYLDRDFEAYGALAKVSAAERAILLNPKPQTDEERELQRSVFRHFGNAQEKQLAEEILTKGKFTVVQRLRAAAITEHSLLPRELEEVKDLLAQVKPERRSALNDAYAKRYGANLNNIVEKFPKEDQPTVAAMIQSVKQNSAEQIAVLSRQRKEAESGLLGGVDFGDRYTAIQSSDNFRKANEKASSKFEALSRDQSEKLLVTARETMSAWRDKKNEVANTVVDGTIVVGSLAVTIGTMGATTPMLVGVVGLSGSAAKVAGSKALLGDGYDLGKSEKVLLDAAAGFTNASVSLLGPEQLAVALKLGDRAAAATTNKFITLLGEETLVKSKYLIKDGGEEVIEKTLKAMYHESIVRSKNEISEQALKSLVAEVATDGSKDLLENALLKAVRTGQPTKSEVILKELALNSAVGSVAGASSELVVSAGEWDSSMSVAENLSEIGKRTGGGALLGAGAGAAFTVSLKVVGATASKTENLFGKSAPRIAETGETLNIGLRPLDAEGNVIVTGLAEKDLYMITLRKGEPPEILTHDGTLKLKGDEKLVVMERDTLRAEYANLSPVQLKQKFEEDGISGWSSYVSKAVKSEPRIFVESKASNQATNFYLPVETAVISSKEEKLQQQRPNNQRWVIEHPTPFLINSDLEDLPDGGKRIKQVILDDRSSFQDAWSTIKQWDRLTREEGEVVPFGASQSWNDFTKSLSVYISHGNDDSDFRREGIRHEWSHYFERNSRYRGIYDDALELEKVTRKKPLLLNDYAGTANGENWAVHIGEAYMADSDEIFRSHLVEPAKGTTSQIKELIHAKVLEEALLDGAKNGHKAPRYERLLARSRWAQSELAPGAKLQLEELIASQSPLLVKERDLALSIYPKLFGEEAGAKLLTMQPKDSAEASEFFNTALLAYHHKIPENVLVALAKSEGYYRKEALAHLQYKGNPETLVLARTMFEDGSLLKLYAQSGEYTDERSLYQQLIALVIADAEKPTEQIKLITEALDSASNNSTRRDQLFSWIEFSGRGSFEPLGVKYGRFDPSVYEYMLAWARQQTEQSPELLRHVDDIQRRLAEEY